MRSQTPVVAFVAVLGLLATSGRVVAGNFDGGWIKGLFPGYLKANVQGYRVLFAGNSNGSLKGEAYGRQDQGHWFVKGDALCVSWEKWTKGKTTCGSISQQGGWFVASGGSGEMLKFRRAVIVQQ